MTEALRKQQVRSLKPLDAWVFKLFEDGVLPGPGVDRRNRALSRSKPDIDGRNPRNGLYDLAREQPALRHADEQVFAAHLKDKWGCTPWRSNLARGWEFPPLAAVPGALGGEVPRLALAAPRADGVAGPTTTRGWSTRGG